jgi:hypothetical protein
MRGPTYRAGYATVDVYIWSIIPNFVGHRLLSSGAGRAFFTYNYWGIYPTSPLVCPRSEPWFSDIMGPLVTVREGLKNAASWNCVKK